MAIASDDRVYAWYSDGKASAGNSGDLDAYRPVYDYQAASAPLRNRYSRITIQHLFDHRSGFQRSGDWDSTSTMFAPQLNGAEPSYDQIHRHFLRTRPLKWAPGTSSSYSNHGFGLFTLIVKKLTGRSYRNYAINNYLKPMGLKDTVRPQGSADVSDSFSHEYTWDDNRQNPIYKTLPFEDPTTGLAAGGWTASAEGLLAITKKLNEQYSFEEIDSFGWGRESRGKLEHNGLTGGGAAYVAMFPNPYVSISGKDLSGVHVAIAVNTTYSGESDDRFDGITGRMETLANEIALSVPNSSIPVDFSLWPKR